MLLRFYKWFYKTRHYLLKSQASLVTPRPVQIIVKRVLMNSYILFWKCSCDVPSLSFKFSDPCIQKEALQAFVIVHWSVSRQMIPRHLPVSNERVTFLDSIGSTVLVTPCEQKEEESKILNLLSSVEMKITERVTSWKNIYLIWINDDIVTRWWWCKFGTKSPHSKVF